MGVDADCEDAPHTTGGWDMDYYGPLTVVIIFGVAVVVAALAACLASYFER